MATDSIEALIEEYLARKLSGSPVSPDELAAAHPEHADVLRRRLAQLGALDLLQPAGSAAKFDVPRSFDGFELVRELGRGGMGVVYEARQVALGRRVAIKVIAGGGALSPRLRERFEREITTLARISHPGIVKVFGSGSVAGAPYVAMELVEGEPLTRRLPGDGERVSREHVDEFVRIGERVARALAHVHELGVVHRDVKPGNVLIDARGEPVLLDFGLARDDERESVTHTGEFVGTLAYTAPEQARGERVDRRADVYGLGATLYHLVTGSPPYRARSIADLVRQLEAGPPSSASRLNPSLPRDLATVIEHATQPDPTQRYASCSDLADELARVRDGVPIRAQLPSTWTVLAHVARRHKALVIGTAAVLVALAIGLAAVLVQVQRTRHENERVRAQRDYNANLLDEALNEMDPARRIDFVQRIEGAARARFASDTEMLVFNLEQMQVAVASAGDYSKATEYANEATSIREARGTTSDPEALLARFEFASTLQSQNEFERALAVYEDVERGVKGTDDAAVDLVLAARHNRAQCLLELGRVEQGMALLRATIDELSRTHGEANRLYLSAQNTLANWLVRNGERDEGRRLLENIVEIRRLEFGADDHDSLAWLTNLANVLVEEREWLPAIALLQQVVDVRTAKLPLDHPDRLLALHNLGAAMSNYGQVGQAERVLKELQETRERREGCYTRGALEGLLVRAGNFARYAYRYRNDAQVKEAQLGLAENAMDELLERMRAIAVSPDDTLLAAAHRDQAQLLQMRERWDESEAPALEAWRVIKPESVCRDVIEKLADHWDAIDRSDDAARLRALLDE